MGDPFWLNQGFWILIVIAGVLILQNYLVGRDPWDPRWERWWCELKARRLIRDVRDELEAKRRLEEAGLERAQTELPQPAPGDDVLAVDILGTQLDGKGGEVQRRPDPPSHAASGLQHGDDASGGVQTARGGDPGRTRPDDDDVRHELISPC